MFFDPMGKNCDFWGNFPDPEVADPTQPEQQKNYLSLVWLLQATFDPRLPKKITNNSQPKKSPM